jgi:hypothetical protein
MKQTTAPASFLAKTLHFFLALSLAAISLIGGLA